MTEHPSEEDMVDSYYSALESGLQNHFNACHACADLYRKISEALETASEAGLPQRDAHYGAEVWARVAPHLPQQRKPSAWRRRWPLVPALAAALALAFMASMWTERRAAVVPAHQLAHVKLPVSPRPESKVARVHPQPAVRRNAGTSDSVQDAKLVALNGLLDADAKALPEVLNMIQGSTSDRTKEHALFVLAQSDSPNARVALMNFAKQESNPPLQTRALRMLGMLGSDGERKELAQLYQTSTNLALKREIVSITEPQEAIVFPKGTFVAGRQQLLNSVFLAADSHVLLDVLKKQPDVGIRVATIRSLAVMGEQSQLLATVYRTDKDEAVRRAVLDALLVQRNRSALEELARNEPDASRKADILTRLASIR